MCGRAIGVNGTATRGSALETTPTRYAMQKNGAILTYSFQYASESCLPTNTVFLNVLFVFIISVAIQSAHRSALHK